MGSNECVERFSGEREGEAVVSCGGELVVDVMVVDLRYGTGQ